MMSKKYPPQKPYKPIEPKRVIYRLSNSKPGDIIYRDVSVLGDRDDVDLEQFFADQDEELPIAPKIRQWQNLSLQDIVDLAPPNTKLCDIILKIYIPRYQEYIDVSFGIYERDVDAEEDAYKDALKKYKDGLQKYNTAMIEYEKQLYDYEKDKKDEKIKILKNQIKELEETNK